MARSVRSTVLSQLDRALSTLSNARAWAKRSGVQVIGTGAAQDGLRWFLDEPAADARRLRSTSVRGWALPPRGHVTRSTIRWNGRESALEVAQPSPDVSGVFSELSAAKNCRFSGRIPWDVPRDERGRLSLELYTSEGETFVLGPFDVERDEHVVDFRAPAGARRGHRERVELDVWCKRPLGNAPALKIGESWAEVSWGRRDAPSGHIWECAFDIDWFDWKTTVVPLEVVVATDGGTQTTLVHYIESGGWSGSITRAVVIPARDTWRLEIEGSVRHEIHDALELFVVLGRRYGPLAKVARGAATTQQTSFSISLPCPANLPLPEVFLECSAGNGVAFSMMGDGPESPVCAGAVTEAPPAQIYGSVVGLAGWIAAPDIDMRLQLRADDAVLSDLELEPESEAGAVRIRRWRATVALPETGLHGRRLTVRASDPVTGRDRSWGPFDVRRVSNEALSVEAVDVSRPFFHFVMPPGDLGETWRACIATEAAPDVRCARDAAEVVQHLVPGQRNYLVFPVREPPPSQALLGALRTAVDKTRADVVAPPLALRRARAAHALDAVIAVEAGMARNLSSAVAEGSFEKLGQVRAVGAPCMSIDLSTPVAGQHVGAALSVEGRVIDVSGGPVEVSLEVNGSPVASSKHVIEPNVGSVDFSFSIPWCELKTEVLRLRVVAESPCEVADRVVDLFSSGLLLFVEEPRSPADFSARGLRIAGWAITREDEPIEIECRLADRVVATFRPAVPRPDVERVYRGAPGADRAGFEATIPAHLLAAGNLTVRAWTASGEIVTKGPIAIRPGRAPESGALEEVLLLGRQRVRVRGWYFEPDQLPDEIEVAVDGARAGSLTLNRRRLDVRAVDPRVHSEYCGFDGVVEVAPSTASTIKLSVHAVVRGVKQPAFASRTVEVPPAWSEAAALTSFWETPADEAFVSAAEIVVSGWAFIYEGRLRIEVWAGDQLVCEGRPSEARPDVALAHGLDPSQHRTGFVFRVPISTIASDRVELRLRYLDDDTNRVLLDERRVVFAAAGTDRGDSDERYARWLSLNTPTAADAAEAVKLMQDFRHKPVVSVVMPVYESDPTLLRRAIESVRRQWYPAWQLCIADDASTSSRVAEALDYYRSIDARIVGTRLSRNGGISRASNAAAKLASGELLLFLDHDDEIAPHCLFEIVKRLQDAPQADIFYTDDDKITTDGRRFGPQFKPPYSPELLLSFQYFAHALCVRRDLFEQVGGFRPETDGSQDYDLLLRMVERKPRIEHVPTVLYHWRVTPQSTATSGDTKGYSLEAGRRAIQDALARRGLAGSVERTPEAIAAGVGQYRIRWQLPEEPPLVSIIIPSRNNFRVLEQCLKSLESTTSYPRYEIIVVDDGSDDHATRDFLAGLKHCVVRNDDRTSFNFSRLINRGAKQARGEHLLVLNDDTTIITSDWLQELVGWMDCPEIGLVGCKLLYPNGLVQHAGIQLGVRGTPAPAFNGLPASSPGYFGLASNARNCSAVTFAAALLRRSVFDELGGLDEEAFPRAYQDPDFCLRAMARGYRIVYTPHALLHHHEAYSKPASFSYYDDMLAFKERWGVRDPLSNPNISTESAHFEVLPKRVYFVNPRALPKVAALVHNLRPEGAPMSQLELLSSMTHGRNIDLDLFLLGKGPLLADYTKLGLPMTRAPELEVQGGNLGELRELARRWLTERTPEVAYANTLDAFWFVEVANDLGIPTLFNVRESVDHREYFQHFFPRDTERAIRTLDEANLLVFVSEATRRLYQENGVRSHCELVPNGLDFRKLDLKMAVRPAERIPGRLIGCVGTTCERKGQHVLVGAFADLLDARPGDDLHLVLVGAREGRFLDWLRDYIARLGLTDRVTLVAEKHGVLGWYGMFDIFACPSYEESAPRVVLEAMGAALPIVASDCFGVREQIVHGQTGLLVPPGDRKALARELLRLLDDPALGKALGTRASRSARTQFTLAETASAYAEQLRELSAAGRFVAGGP